ncbi:hypothetical protein BV22DRAFT_801576 [Leucogyrophana mollusca]|uniref:Uncharacterized protein n=1 Tax=Leucogyrophana mollusca TaxID=85980 RepID=A0ACB8B5E3_9AGAM|nr:hypothetical protein BV22DRAFT_801576 [Leucogyrophana mollusca]
MRSSTPMYGSASLSFVLLLCFLVLSPCFPVSFSFMFSYRFSLSNKNKQTIHTHYPLDYPRPTSNPGAGASASTSAPSHRASPDRSINQSSHPRVSTPTKPAHPPNRSCPDQ